MLSAMREISPRPPSKGFPCDVLMLPQLPSPASDGAPGDTIDLDDALADWDTESDSQDDKMAPAPFGSEEDDTDFTRTVIDPSIREEMLTVVGELKKQTACIQRTLDAAMNKLGTGSGVRACQVTRSSRRTISYKEEDDEAETPRHRPVSVFSMNQSDHTESRESRRGMPISLWGLGTAGSPEERRGRRLSVEREYDKTLSRYRSRSHEITSRFSDSLDSFRESAAKRRLNCNLFQQVVNTKRFNFVVFTLIVANAALIGYEAHINMLESLEQFNGHRHGNFENSYERPSWLAVADVIFNIGFILELGFRLLAHEGHFCIAQEWRWNMFDAFMVGSSMVEIVLLISFNVGYIRVLRVLRVARSFRMIHLLKFTHLRNLRLMLRAVIGSAIPLLWAGVILMIVMFLFGVIFLNGIAQFVVDADSTTDALDVDLVVVFFCDLPQTLLTLFMSITGGVSWWDVIQLLINVWPGYAFIFVVYIMVTVLAALNIITGIFVNDAVQMARMDHEWKVQRDMEENKFHLEKLKELFMEIDTSSTGTISLQEFTTQMEREEVRFLFSVIGLDVSDAVAFFKLLDVDGSVSLEIDEFVMGCMRFRNNPSNVNIECSILETKQLMVKSIHRQKRVEEKFVSLEKGVEDICANLGIRRKKLNVGKGSQSSQVPAKNERKSSATS